ncbi:MAG TPA: hypothetical protein PLC05_01240 [bacterium]|nr:hypothetical protein [bacterium]
MPENFEPYNLESAQEEAKRIGDIVGPKGTKEDCVAAHDLVEVENFKQAKQEAKLKLQSYISRVGDDSRDSRRDAENSLKEARALQEKFNIPAGELEADPQLQEEAKQAMLKDLSSGFLDSFETIRSNFFVPDEVCTQPEFQEVARNSTKLELSRYLDLDRSGKTRERHLWVARSLQEKFNIPAGELEADPQLQEAAKQTMLKVLNMPAGWSYDVEQLEEIRTNLFLSDEVYTQPEFQEAARRSVKSHLSEYLERYDIIKKREEYLREVRWLQEKFNIPAGELEADPQLQEEAKQAMLKELSSGFLDSFETIRSNFFVPDEVYTQPEFQEVARNSAKLELSRDLGQYDGRYQRRISREYLRKARSLQEKFNIPAGELEVDPQLQEEAKQAMLKVLSSGFLGSFETIRSNFFVSDKIYSLPEFQEAARRSVKLYLLEYLGLNSSDEDREVSLRTVRSLQEKFNIPAGELEVDPQLQEAAKKAIVSKVERYVSSDHPSDNDLQKAMDIKRKFNIDDQSFAETSHILILDNLKSGNINNVVKIQKVFSISDEKLLNPEYVALTERALVLNFKKGDRDSIEKIKEKFLLSLNTTEFIKNQYQGYISEEEWDLVVRLKSSFPECDLIFQEFIAKQKEIAKNGELPFFERKTAFDILAGLVKNGETTVAQEFSEIISARTKQKEIPESKWGLDPLQEGAFYTLMRLDNPDSNSALFGLMFSENVNSTVKYAILKKLLRNDSSFLDSQFKENLHAWLYSVSPKKADWRDLQFISEIQKIPSKELRDKSLKTLWLFKSLDFSVFPLYKTWSEKYNNIPQKVFLQIVDLDWTCESEGLLDKFQKLFTSIRKENSKKDSLLYGITNVLEADSRILKLLGEKLSGIDFGSKQDADSMSELFRRIIFLNRIENIKNYQQDEYDLYEEDEDYEEQEQEEQLSPEIAEIFSQETKTLNSLVAIIKEVATKKFQEILPNENITAEKIEAIETQWGDLEPIFTYLGRFPSLRGYIAEIVANIDTEEGWKKWRYDLTSEGVRGQIGHLSEEQLEIWKGDYFSEIDDIVVAETGSDKPKQIQHILREAVLQHRHIFNPEMGQNRNEFIQKTLEEVFAEMEKTPDRQSAIIEREVKKILADSRSIDAIIDFNNLPRLRQSVDLIFSAGPEISPSSKIKNIVGFISSYLPRELRRVLEDNYSALEDQKKMAADSLFTSRMREAIEQKAREVEEDYRKTLDSDIWERFQLDKSNLKNLEQFYQKRQELKSATDLLRLLNLSNKLIATNRIVEKEDKKGGETIVSVLERLKKYFKDSPLLQDIDNIDFILKERIDFGGKRRLAMIFTDNVQMLWQVGKYPLGNGSCQHYAEGSYARQLMGYVGDPNCKVAYLIDLNRLPQEIRGEIEEKGFEEVKDEIPRQELLNASLARSIVKMTKDHSEKPVILMEPTYTVVYKDDVSMDKHFDLFVDLMVAEPMRAKIARGGGSESVIVGPSLSPGGQYEDMNLGGVKIYS